MLKKDAIRVLLGVDDERAVLKEDAQTFLHGVISKAARAVGVSPQAVKNWPDPLPRRIEDRVLATLYRREHGNQLPQNTGIAG